MHIHKTQNVCACLSENAQVQFVQSKDDACVHCLCMLLVQAIIHTVADFLPLCHPMLKFFELE